MWEITLQHEGLKKHRVIKGQDQRVVEEKARLQEEAWEEQWERKLLEAEERRQEREERAEKKEVALERTQEAQSVLDSLEQTLAHTLNIDDTIDWESLRDKRGFSVQRPASPPKPEMAEPSPTDPQLKPKYGLIDYLIPGMKKREGSSRTSALPPEAVIGGVSLAPIHWRARSEGARRGKLW